MELAASTVGSVGDVRLLQRRTAALGQFFSPPVREAVSAGDLEIELAPRETHVAVLFCDLRGFSRSSEQSADDLFGLLHRVSESLGTMTRLILAHGGVIGDFHGDAAMGFWGWPLPQPDRVARACRAALAIRSAFEQAAARDHHALAGFRVGMGLATGRAVAGKIGTVDQVKVTAFGPVVNLAARLEGMTRSLGTAILIDQATADAAPAATGAGSGPGAAACLGPTLRAAKRPAGVRVVSRSPRRCLAPQSSDYPRALEAFRQGHWDQARQLLEPAAADDPAARFLLDFMALQAHQVPAGWTGVIPLSKQVARAPILAITQTTEPTLAAPIVGRR